MYCDRKHTIIIEGLVPRVAMFRDKAFGECLDHEDFDIFSGLIHWGWMDCWKVVEAEAGRTWLKEVGPWAHALETVCLYVVPSPFLFLPLSAFWLSWAEQLSSAMLFLLDVQPCLRLKTMEPADHRLQSLKAWPKIHLSSFKLCFSGICHSNEKLT